MSLNISFHFSSVYISQVYVCVPALRLSFIIASVSSVCVSEIGHGYPALKSDPTFD